MDRSQHLDEARDTRGPARPRMGVLGCLAAVAIAACGPADDLPRTGECPDSATDERTAAAMAAACGGRIEIESARTEYSQVYLEPSGHHTIETAIVPQRARRLDGTWGPIDTTLQQIGDVLGPVATAANVRFSTGGSGPFATLTRDGHSLTLSWPAPLPRPTVSGKTATYAEVLPDVDLVVEATDTGFSHLLVIKTARAAANPMVRRASYRIGGDATLTATPQGGLIAEAGGVRIASADPPVMWDAVQRQGASALAAPGDRSAAVRTAPGKIAPVGSSISAGHLVLTPDPSMLADPGTAFPLTIDPLFVVGEAQWAYATSNNANAPTTDSSIRSGDPSPAAAELSVGVNPASGARIRSFMRFDTAALAGKQILSASISGRVDHTWKCSASRPTFFYRTAGISAAPRQSWPGPGLQLLLSNNNVHANEDSCNEANMPFEVSSGTLINDLQGFANASASSYFVGISAGENTGGTNETVTERWMRYFLSDFRLNVTYNTQPGMPDTLTVDGKPCASGANRPFVKTTTPTLRAHVTDPDGDAMNVWFAWAKWNGSSFVDEPGGGMQGSVPSGGTAVFNVTGNVDGGIYAFRSQSDDSPSHSPYLVSDVTSIAGNCEWQVDITPPDVPAVIADVYSEGQTSGSVGQTGRFTFSSSSDTRSFLWGWSDPPTTPVTPSILGGSVSIDWTPTSSGAQTLFVRAIDRAGNESNKAYQFIVAPESTALARWLLNDAAGATQLADDTGHRNSLTVTGGVLGAPGRLVPGADGASRSAMQFGGAGDVATTGGPVLANTSKSFSVTAWVKLADNTVSHRALEQVGATGGNSAFALEYDRTTNAWKFTAPTADGSAFPGATSTSTPRLATWTHLAGSYDSAAGALRLYVNGALETTVTGITTWTANGALRIGASWAGAIGEVQVWNRVISAAEVFNLSDPIQVGRVGDWHMDEIGLGPARDSSDLVHDLTFYNGASIPVSGAGQTGTGLRLDGVDDYAAPDGQVLHTDQSFTVSVWARPTTTAVQQVLVSQQSVGGLDGFALYFGPDTGGTWKFRKYASATDSTNTTIAVAPAVNPTTSFHHLVGVFDAQHQEIRLYVDGVLEATSPMNAAWRPWDATGPLLIGRDQDGTGGSGFTRGDLDEVRVYQGVVADVSRIP